MVSHEFDATRHFEAAGAHKVTQPSLAIICGPRTTCRFQHQRSIRAMPSRHLSIISSINHCLHSNPDETVSSRTSYRHKILHTSQVVSPVLQGYQMQIDLCTIKNPTESGGLRRQGWGGWKSRVSQEGKSAAARLIPTALDYFHVWACFWSLRFTQEICICSSDHHITRGTKGYNCR